jgi:hypothetical protein
MSTLVVSCILLLASLQTNVLHFMTFYAAFTISCFLLFELTFSSRELILPSRVERLSSGDRDGRRSVVSYGGTGGGGEGRG